MPKISRLILLFAILISAFGLTTVLILAKYGSPSTFTSTWRKPIAGSIFTAICLLGMLSALSPSKCMCSETYGHQFKSQNPPTNQISNLNINTKGHHKDCGKFSDHIIRVKNTTLCAACTGLFIGSTCSIIGASLYFFVGLDLFSIRFQNVVIGVALVTLGFLQLKFKGIYRSIMNVLFVLGAFLILTGLDETAKSLPIDLFTLVLITFWIFTRILLSQWDHRRICMECPNPC
jgi:hypothetical protein